MRFIIMTKNMLYVVEAKDFEEAVALAYDDHTKYNDVYGIVRIPDE